MLMILFSLLLSLVLYFIAPLDYSFSFCLLLFILMAINSLYLIKKTIKDKNYVNFNTIFLLVNGVIIYVYPLLIYPNNPELISRFRFGFDISYINKATALCTFSLLAYLLGYITSFYKTKNIASIPNPIKYVKCILFLKIFFLIIIAIILYLYLPQFTNKFFELRRYEQLLQFVPILLICRITVVSYTNQDKIYNSPKRFIKMNLFPLIATLLLSIVFLRIGIRYPIIQYITAIIAVYTIFVRKIKLIPLTIILLTFIIMLYCTSLLRTGSDVSILRLHIPKIIESPLLSLSDLIAVARNLYIGMEYVDTHGILYGQSFVPFLFAPIPLLPTIMPPILISKTTLEVSTSEILFQFSGDYWYPENLSGLGGGCIIDLYMNVGLLCGAIFFLLGKVVCVSYKNQHNIYWLVTYVTLLSSAVFMPRGHIFISFRTIVWSLIILFVLSNINRVFPARLRK